MLASQRCNFPQSWRTVNEICLQAFDVFNKKPENLVATYNELNHRLCEAHAILYRLTAFPCIDCPALVRGSSFTKVVGDKPESTQVLVVYYLLREMLKRQMNQSREAILAGNAIIRDYLDAFEKLTGGVNLVKCVFTYMHWVWEKLGLPTEHIVLPTETIATHLWTDIVVDEVKVKLAREMTAIVNAARKGTDLDYGVVEDAKRLSLNLAILNDGRQTFYTTIIEGPYQAGLTAYYTKRKPLFKRKGAERYVYLSLKAVTREGFLAKCLLARFSLEKVRALVIELLVGSETEYLKRAAELWLKNKDEGKRKIYHASLFGLYELLGGGAKPTWMEDLLTAHVTETATKDMTEYQSPSDIDASTRVMRSIRETYTRLRSLLVDVFGNKPLLFSAMLTGLKHAVNELCNDPRVPSFDATTVVSLAKIASEEISSGKNYSPTEGNWIADVYSLLEGKEVFHTTYQKMLQVRLLKYACFSLTEEQCLDRFAREERMLSELFRRGKSFDFASACRRMLKDIYIISYQCKRFLHSPVPLSPLVLTRFAWRELTPPTAEDTALLSPAVQDATKGFVTLFEANRFGSGRRLSFLPHYSTYMVRMRGVFGGVSINEALHVSYFQFSILTLFNQAQSLTFQEIEARLKISLKLIQEHTKPLIGAKLLLYNPSTQCLSLNRDYRSSQTRLFLVPEFDFNVGNESAAADHSQERSAAVHQYLPACESCIVKILKREKEMSLDDIQAHVRQTLSKYDVTQKDVKRALEKLIEREFVGRGPDGKTLFYIA